MWLYSTPGQIFMEPSIATFRHRGVSTARSSDIAQPSRCGSRRYWLRPRPKTPLHPQMLPHVAHRRSHSIPTQKTLTPTGGVRCAKPKKRLEPQPPNAFEAARRAEVAAVAEAAARREEREIAEAHASAQRQAARYADSEIRRRACRWQQGTELPGRISDPYSYKPQCRRTLSQNHLSVPSKAHYIIRPVLCRNRS